jgi:iron(III) transport system ATP-binding protein
MSSPSTTAIKADTKTGSAVEFRNVTKRYGSVAAVNDISFTVAQSTLVTLLGPSGCGKTTTLRLIAGLEHASEGQIIIGGRDVTALSAAERDVSMVFQSYALFPHMTVLENAAYGLVVSGIPKARAYEQANAKLDLVGLKGLNERLPSELSGGQQQRVAVARAIVLEPQVLLFDEPLSNLDAKLRRRVREDIRALQKDLNLTVVYVTHDQEEALAISDRVIVMANAVIAQDGAPRALYEQPANRFIADFIGDANIVAAALRHTSATEGLVRIGGAEIALAHRGVAEGPVEVAVRPHLVTLQPTSGTDGFVGEIAKATYVGPRVEYSVTTPAGELFVVSTDVAHPLAPGTRVLIGLAPASIAIIPAA